MQFKRLALSRTLSTDFSIRIPELIAAGVGEKVSVEDLALLTKQPELAKIVNTKNGESLEIHVGKGVYVPAAALANCVNWTEFSASQELTDSYLDLIYNLQMPETATLLNFASHKLEVHHPQLKHISTRDLPGIATIKAYTNFLDSKANTWSNPKHLQVFLDNWRGADLNTAVRLSIMHSIMVNDGLNTLKALHVLNRLDGQPNNPEINPDILFSAQRILDKDTSLFQAPQYISASSSFDVAKKFYKPNKAIFCFNTQNSHITVKNLSNFENESEFPIQAGERYKKADDSPWFQYLQRKHPHTRLIGFEPVTPSDWNSNPSLTYQYQVRPWLIEKMLKLAWLTERPDLATRIVNLVPEASARHDQIAASYSPEARTAAILAKIEAAKGNNSALHTLCEGLIDDAQWALASKAAEAATDPTLQFVLLKQILNKATAPKFEALQEETAQKMRSLISQQPAASRNPLILHWINDFYLQNPIPKLLAELLTSIQSLPKLDQQIYAIMQLDYESCVNGKTLPDEQLICAWQILDHCQSTKDCAYFVQELRQTIRDSASAQAAISGIDQLSNVDLKYQAFQSLFKPLVHRNYKKLAQTTLQNRIDILAAHPTLPQFNQRLNELLTDMALIRDHNPEIIHNCLLLLANIPKRVLRLQLQLRLYARLTPKQTENRTELRRHIHSSIQQISKWRMPGHLRKETACWLKANPAPDQPKPRWWFR